MHLWSAQITDRHGGESRRRIINKIIIVEEEADESYYWLELIEAVLPAKQERLSLLKREANELTAIFTAIGRTAKLNQRQNTESKNQDKINK